LGAGLLSSSDVCRKKGDHFIYENVSTTITKTNSRRVLEVLFKIIAVEEAQEVG